MREVESLLELTRPPGAMLFDSSGSPSVDVEELARYGERLLGGPEVERHGDLIAFCLERTDASRVEEAREELAGGLAAARVTEPGAERPAGAPSPHVLAYERRMLEREPPRPAGVLYDGFSLCAAYGRLMSGAGVSPEDLVVVITDQLFGTFDEGDSRYHARVAVFGHPTVVSTSGLVVAPARPRSYYLGRQLGIPGPPAAEGGPGEWLVPEDPRTTEVIKGYVAQAAFYYMTGEPFCQERGCRLFNAHWQKDLLFSQLYAETEFCARHERLVGALSRSG